LKENFDRFNFALYKEKQMADFRRWFIALAVLALMAGAASAQVGVITGPATSALACTAAAAGTPELRPEGFTELAGDIIITCTGGPVLQVGAQIPTTNVIVYVTPTVPVTSRIFSGAASEALLIIDEAGANVTTGAAGYGPQAPQSLCSSGNEQAAGQVPCNLITASVAAVGGGNILVPVGGTGNINGSGGTAQNVFQGKVGDYGPNTIAFYDVPVLPPASAGVSRVFRITNIRIPVSGSGATSFSAFISTNPNQTLPITTSTLPIGVVGPATSMGVKLSSADPFPQCTPQKVALASNLIYTEGFATAFRTRVVPGGTLNGVPLNNAGNTTYAAEAQNIGGTLGGTGGFVENTPGGLYGGFAADTESGFIFNQLSGTPSGSAYTYTAGLADFGTRLKAEFYNIPASLTLYVSVTSGGSVPPVIGGTSTLPYAVLVGTSYGASTEDAPDGASFAPIAGTTTGSDGLSAIALSPNASGIATAIWEVTNANPSAQDVLAFSVYIGYAPQAPGTFPNGTPYTSALIPPYTLTNVALSFSPEPTYGAIPATPAIGQNPIPRFAVLTVQGGQWATINLCQTTLLYPFVTAAPGFDTGLAVSNTSSDPFGTRHQSGSCTMWPYGVTVGAGGATTAFTTNAVLGCDMVANPLPGTNCFPTVPTGTTGVSNATGLFNGFQGYVIAVCNFQYAHGYAAVTDTGIRNIFTSYLALELAPPQSISCSGGNGSSVSCSLSGGVGSPRSGISSIEELVH